MSETFDQSDLLRELSQRCESMGSQSALSRQIGVPVSQINEALKKRRPISEAMANAMGFARVDRYVRVRKPRVSNAAVAGRGEAA